MKKIKYLVLASVSALMLNSCNFLDETPQGILDEEQVKGPEQI